MAKAAKKTQSKKSAKVVRIKKEDLAALLKQAFTGDSDKVIRKAIRKHKFSKNQAERLIQESFYTLMQDFEKQINGFSEIDQFEDLGIKIDGATKFAGE